ncbi:PAS domain-containing hybrid sensor histidine kinase/response regulator [Oceaniferula spumae]
MENPASTQSEANALDSLLTFAPIGLAFFDTHFRYTRVNEYLAHLNNLPAEEHVEMLVKDLHPRSATLFEQSIRQVFAEGRPLPVTKQKIDLAEEPQDKSVSISFFPVTDEFDNVTEVGAVVFIHEVNESDDKLLPPHELKFRHLAETLPQIVWTSDPDGTVDYVSPHWTTYSGLDIEDPDFLNIDAAIHPEDIKLTRKAWKRSVDTGEIYDHTYRLLSQSGEYRHHAARAVPVRDQNGVISRWYGTSTDIESHKKTENSLKEATQAKDKFIAMLGHELRNPLAAITSHYEIMGHPHASKEEHASAYQQLGKQIEHLARLVDDTLDIARLTKGKMRIETELTEINQLVENALTSHKSGAEEKKIELSYQPYHKEQWVVADPIRITQCVTNLLNNAIKFTPIGGAIRVSVTPDKKNPRNTCMVVSDNGLGMSKPEIEKLFEPFAQSKNADRTSRDGLGLGLAIIRQLMELHGGKVVAFSEGKGKGTEITLSLPLSDAAQERTLESEDENSTCDDGTSLSSKILVIEDDENVAEALKLLLELDGHEVAHTVAAEDGLELIHSFVPEIVLCDLTLQGELSGWDFAQSVRNLPENNQVRYTYLVALSGHSSPRQSEKSLKAGFNEHLCKPSTPAQLRGCIIRGKKESSPNGNDS